MTGNQYIVTPFLFDQALPELQNMAAHGWTLNKPRLTHTRKMASISELHRSLADHVSGALKDGRRPVSIAGDCCSSIGVLAGLQRGNIQPTLIWFDAHGDFNTWETTPSGFLGGMPLAMIVGRGEQTLPDAVGLQSLPEQNVILTDGRDLDPGEKVLIGNSGINHLPETSVLLEYPLPPGPLYIHFDTDIINPVDAPAMSYPAPGGPSAEELRRVFHLLARTGRIEAVSMSSWNFDLDEDGQTQRVCMSLLNSLFS